MPANDLPSVAHMRAATAPAGVPPFNVGIVIGPGFIPMDMVGVQTVFGLMPGVHIHLLWKTDELVEGFPNCVAGELPELHHANATHVALKKFRVQTLVCPPIGKTELKFEL